MGRLWEPATKLILQAVAIPRGQLALASGHGEVAGDEITVSSKRGETGYGLCSTAFLEKASRTDSEWMTIHFHADGSWSYVTDAKLTAEGRDTPFAHQDRDTLHRVGEAWTNPWGAMLAKRQDAG